MLKQIDYWMRGYIRFKITGRSVERLINLLIEQEIELWDVSRIEGQLFTNIKLEDSDKVKEYLEEINCNYQVVSYHGLPHLFRRILNRKFIIGGFFTFIISIYVLSSFVFFIEIKGTKKLSQQNLKSQLVDLKVRPGVLKSGIALEKLAEIIIKKNRRVAWANAYFKGTKLVVEIVEKKIIDTETMPSDIVAKKAGLITELIVFRGTPQVEEGETVKKNQILISREVNISRESETEEEKEKTEPEIKKVKAAGIVKAKVWYEGYGEASLVESFTQTTATREKSIILKYKNKEFIISGPQQPPYNYFFVEENIKSLAEWRNINFPLEIITREYVKLKKVKVKRTINQAKEIAKEKAVESILQRLGKEVIIMNSDLKLIASKKEKNIIRIRSILEVEEEITARRE